MCTEVGQKFLAMYSGITDPAQFEKYMKTLGLIYAFNIAMLMPDVPDAADCGQSHPPRRASECRSPQRNTLPQVREICLIIFVNSK